MGCSLRFPGARRMSAAVEDTYAEAFRSIYAEVLITARDRTWLDHAVGGRDRQRLEHDPVRLRGGARPLRRPGTRRSRRPTAGPGRSCSSTCRGSARTASSSSNGLLGARQPERADLPDGAPASTSTTCEEPYFQLGRKLAYFGDGHQFRDERFGRTVWVVPILGGEFVVDRRFGYADGLMGGNLWFFGDDGRRGAAARARRRRPAAGRCRA